MSGAIPDMFVLRSNTGMLWWAEYPEALGYLPDFLSEADPRPAAQQFQERYKFGGWSPGEAGLRFAYRPGPEGGPRGSLLLYPGDPPLMAVGGALLRDEEVVVFQASYVMVRQPDGSHEVSRLD
jgi:hypothetical protein